jgi:hypothetical protein
MQRAIADLSGLHSTAADQRPWLRHAAWPAAFHPLSDAAIPDQTAPPATDDYPFVPVEGEGVHEIPVGPVHAGIIEPGHFRFSIVGEKVLRLEQHLGYVHKGIERRFTELPLLEGHRLAARVSGDSAVAFSWAYCQALEGMSAARVRRGRFGCERLLWSWSVLRITSEILGRWAMTRASRSASRNSLDSRNSCCAPPNMRWDSVTSWTWSCPEARASTFHLAAQTG